MKKRLYFFENEIDYSYVKTALYEMGIDNYKLSDKEFYSKYSVINNNLGYKKTIKYIYSDKCNQILFTNCVYLLGEHCFYNQQEKKWDIYIWKGKKHFLNIKELANKLINKSSNIEKMYRNGEFDI